MHHFKPEHSCFLLALGLILLDLFPATMLSGHRKSESVTSQKLVVLSPNGGQVLRPHSRYTIRWLTGGADTVALEYSLDGGNTWLPITDVDGVEGTRGFHVPQQALRQFIPEESMHNIRSYDWDVPDTECTEALVRVIDNRTSTNYDICDHPFTISERVTEGWTQQSVGAPVTLWSVSIVDDSVAWTCGRDGVVFRTTNGGTSWAQGSNLPTHVTGISGVDRNTAFVCVNLTDDGRVYRTTNGGVNWTLVLQHTGTSASIKNVHMFSTEKGVAVGDRDPMGGLWKTMKTTTGGATWDTISRMTQPGYGFRNAVAWTSEQRGWFGTDASEVYRTTDGGTTWTPSDLGSFDIYCLALPNEQLGMVSTAFKYIYKTTNGGASWSYASTMPGFPLSIISFISGIAFPTARWWGTNMDEIYRSTDHGVTWAFDALANGYPFNDISMKYVQGKNVIVGYAVAAADGVLMKYYETVTSVPEQSGTLPLSMELYQNYPNPFNPSTTLTFSISQPSMVVMKIYDILGRDVRTLVNEKMERGTHQVQFTADGLSTGMYICKLASNGLVASRKMLFIR